MILLGAGSNSLGSLLIRTTCDPGRRRRLLLAGLPVLQHGRVAHERAVAARAAAGRRRRRPPGARRGRPAGAHGGAGDAGEPDRPLGLGGHARVRRGGEPPRAGGRRRGLRRLRAARPDRARPGQGGRADRLAAHLLQDLGPGRPAHRLRGHAGDARRARALGAGHLRGLDAGPGRGAGLAAGHGRDRPARRGERPRPLGARGAPGRARRRSTTPRRPTSSAAGRRTTPSPSAPA